MHMHRVVVVYRWIGVWAKKRLIVMFTLRTICLIFFKLFIKTPLAPEGGPAKRREYGPATSGVLGAGSDAGVTGSSRASPVALLFDISTPSSLCSIKNSSFCSAIIDASVVGSTIFESEPVSFSATV